VIPSLLLNSMPVVVVDAL